MKGTMSARRRYSAAGYTHAPQSEQKGELYIASVPAGSAQDELRDWNRAGYQAERPWREATDASNIRSVYAEVITAALAEDKSTPLWTGEIWRSENYALEQEKDGWQTEGIGTTIGALGTQDSSPSTNGVFWVTFDPVSYTHLTLPTLLRV